MLKRRIKIFSFIILLQSAVFSQTTVSSISFSGNNYFSEEELMSSMSLKKDKFFSQTVFDTDLKSIREKYRQSGFLMMVISSTSLNYTSDSSYLDIKIGIKENEQVKIGKIILTGSTSISEKQIRNVFETKEGDVLNDAALNNDIIALLDLYEKQGKLFTKASIEDISIYTDNGVHKLSITIGIKEEKKIRIDNIKIKGNEVTNDNVILREVKLGKNKTISRGNLQDIKFRLEKLNIFETVEEPRIYTIKSRNESGLLLQVTEGNTNTFDGVLGYVPPVSDAEDGYFTGLVNLSFRNLFGTARRLDARWQSERKSTQELEFKYGEPYFFGLPLNIGLGFLQRLQDTSYTRRKFDLKGDVLLTDRFTAGFSAGIDRVIPPEDTLQTIFISDSRILYTGAELKYDSRDNIYIPSGGIVYHASYTYGDKKIYPRPNSLSGTSDENYSVQRYSMDLDFYSSFFKRQSLLIRAFFGQVISGKLEDADFFKVGGNNNIRGYREEQFRASDFVYGTVELRYAFSRKSFFSLFTDQGYYYRPEDILNNIQTQEGYLLGYGIGIRLETVLGIIGVSYALGKGDGFLDGKIHFGLINEF